MNRACGGGSSSVFSSALKASVVSMWTSSMMAIRKRSRCGAYRTVSMSSRAFSIFRFEAPSISWTSRDSPRARISRQEAHSPHGVTVGPLSQFRARASSRAVDVFPTPRGPRQEVGGGDAAFGDGVRERARDRLLADEIGEEAGTPFSRKRQVVGHG